MRNLRKYSLLLEDAPTDADFKFETPKDFGYTDPTKSKMYKYAYLNGDWWAKNQQNGKPFNISQMSKEEKYKKFQKSIDILNKAYPQDQKTNTGQDSSPTTGATSSTTQTTGATSSTTQTTGTSSSATGTQKEGTTTSASSELVKKGEEIYKDLVSKKALYQRALSGGRVWVYKGPDLSEQDRDALAAYMQTLGYRLSRGNFDFRKGEKLVFKRNSGKSDGESSQDSQTGETTTDNMLPVATDSPQVVNQKIMNLIKSKRMKFVKTDRSTKKGIDIYRILLNTTSTDEKNLLTTIDYLDCAGYTPFPTIDKQLGNEKSRGNATKSYVFALKDEDTLPKVEAENSTSCFFYFYYNGDLKKRFLSKKWKIKGVDLTPEQVAGIENVTNALNPNLKVKESRILDYENFILLR